MSRIANEPPPRFTNEEWIDANATRYSNAERARQNAERVIAEANRLIDHTQRVTKQTQRDIDKKFEQRIDDVEYWKDEVDKEIEGLKEEIDGLLIYKSRLQKAIEAYAHPLGVTEQCLANREKRKGIDLVHDDVQRELIKEREVIDGILALLHRTLEQTNEQIRRDRSAKYRLEKDLEDKYAALQIDSHSAQLTEQAVNNITVPGEIKNVDPWSVDTSEWEVFSDENVLKGQREQQVSSNVRALVENILNQVFNDLDEQIKRTDKALQDRIREVAEAKAILEEQLGEVNSQLREVERNMEQIKNGIAAKEAPLKLALLRLDNRSQRPNIELVRDPVHYRLLQEVEQIKESIDALREQYERAEQSQKSLIRQQLTLEEDIEIKANTLLIDQVQNQPLRNNLNPQKY